MSTFFLFGSIGIDTSLDSLWQSLKPDAERLCVGICENSTQPYEVLLTQSSSHQAHASPQECRQLCSSLEEAVDHTISMDVGAGDAYVGLQFKAQLALYMFCIGTIMSILSTVLIEWLDGAQIRRAKLDLLLPASSRPPLAERTESCMLTRRPAFGCGAFERRGSQRAQCWRGVHVVLVLAQLAVNVTVVWVPFFERKVTGKLAELLLERGISFGRPYSVYDLATLVHTAGQGDLSLLFNATNWIFLVMAPVLRPLTLLCLLLVPLRRRDAVALHRLSRYVSFFYGLEVLIVAVPLLHQMAKPAIDQATSTLRNWQ